MNDIGNAWNRTNDGETYGHLGSSPIEQLHTAPNNEFKVDINIQSSVLLPSQMANQNILSRQCEQAVSVR